MHVLQIKLQVCTAKKIERKSTALQKCGMLVIDAGNILVRAVGYRTHTRALADLMILVHCEADATKYSAIDLPLNMLPWDYGP